MEEPTKMIEITPESLFSVSFEIDYSKVWLKLYYELFFL